MTHSQPSKAGRLGKCLIALLILDWYMTSLNIIGENSYDTYMREQYGVESIYYAEERYFRYG